ncbi:Bud-site selection protein [Corynespora cassiicola Philippines]|uniref:Bud-site selection protein n=1 Tax=Corynespora cassiicola Philippines TaxID=1448308 RepID=A0A2T2PC64_CORCC|nr:Bud-site selection protein [Corynespora cassiicola Philippines]
MPKRKRASPSAAVSDDEAPRDTGDGSLSRQKKLCSQRIAVAHKSIASALRLGAGFERQKYSRRRKTAKEKDDTKALARLDAEYAVLKSLDIEKVAEQHLRKTIAKVKSIKDHAALPSAVHEIEKTGDSSEALNVKARLYKVQAVKKAVDACIDELKGILGVGGTTANKDLHNVEKRQKKVNAEESEDGDGDEDGEATDFGDDDDAFAAFDARVAAPSSGDEGSDDSLSGDHRPPSIGDSDSEDDDLEHVDSETQPASTSESSEAVEWNGFSNDEAEDSESKDEMLDVAKPKSKKVPDMEKPSSSTFLPSLSHAAYFSGSDSEASDLDEEFKPRKNRRGQKARQKIWEKKFGDKAKHVQKQERDRGWDPKRGAVSNDRGRRGPKPKTGRGPERSGENATPLGTKKPKRDDAGALHPSWAAAKAAKEKKLEAKPQGKKVVFD